MISLIFTSLAVSVDSFLCAFSFSDLKGKRQRFWVVFLITAIVYLMSFIVNEFASLFSGYLNEKTASLGGLILVASGIIALIKQRSEKEAILPLNCKCKGIDDYKYRAITTGFAVGLDGASANLSLAIMGMNAFYVPLTIALTHALAVYLGIKLTQTKLLKKVMKYEYIPPLVLIVIGLIKVKEFFA